MSEKFEGYWASLPGCPGCGVCWDCMIVYSANECPYSTYIHDEAEEKLHEKVWEDHMNAVEDGDD